MRNLVAVLLSTLLFAAADARAELRAELTSEGVQLVDSATGQALSKIATGPGRDVVTRGSTVYVALNDGGIAVIDATDPARALVATKVSTAAPCSRLFFSGDTLLCAQARYELVSFNLAAPLAPVAQALETPKAQSAPVEAVALALPLPEPKDVAPPAVARVSEVSQGRAIIDLGAASGFVEGRRIKIISQRLVAKPDLASGGVREVPSGELVAVVTIEQAEPSRAMARLGRGDAADKGDLVQLTDEPLSERLFVPRRAPFRARIGFFVRPFLGLEGTSKPVGFLSDAFATYYLDQLPLRFEVAFAPFGLALGATTRHYPTTALVTTAYTTDFFEIGLGVGGLLGAAGPMNVVYTPTGPASDGGLESNTGYTINQVLRLGAVDGVNLLWQSSIFSRPQRFVFGVGRAEVNLPLTSRLGLFGGGGGGENGWAMGELGVRTYFNGTGATGTMILSASLGYASIFDGWDGAALRQENVGGPSVAFGMEWRL